MLTNEERINKYNIIKKFTGFTSQIFDLDEYNGLSDDQKKNFDALFDVTHKVIETIKFDIHDEIKRKVNNNLRMTPEEKTILINLLNEDHNNIKQKLSQNTKLSQDDKIFINTIIQTHKLKNKIINPYKSGKYVNMYLIGNPYPSDQQKNDLNKVFESYQRYERVDKPLTLTELFTNDKNLKEGYGDVGSDKFIGNVDKDDPAKTINELITMRKNGSDVCTYPYITEEIKKNTFATDIKTKCNNMRFSDPTNVKHCIKEDLYEEFDENELLIETLGLSEDEQQKLNTGLLLDHDKRQYVFGFSKSLTKYQKFNGLFHASTFAWRAGQSSCHPLIEWSPILNLLFTLCSTYSNTPLIRFILRDGIIHPSKYIVNPIDLKDIYNKKPIAVITVTYEDNRLYPFKTTLTPDHNGYATHILYIFEKDDKYSYDIHYNISNFRFFTGDRKPVTPPTLLSQILITYTEFYQLICHLKLFDYVYRHSNEKYKDTLFIDHHRGQNEKTNAIISDLVGKNKIKKIQYYCIEANVEQQQGIKRGDDYNREYIITNEEYDKTFKYNKDLFNAYDDPSDGKRYIIKKDFVMSNKINEDKLINLIKSQKGQKGQNGGKNDSDNLNIELQMTKKYKLSDNFVASKYFDKYFHLIHHLAHNYKKMFEDQDNLYDNIIKFSFRINKYEFIQPQNIASSTQLTFHTSKFENRIQKRMKILDITQPYETIIKYHPITLSFYFYYEIIFNFNIVSSNANVLLITAGMPTFIESYYYLNKKATFNLLFLSKYSYWNKNSKDNILTQLQQYVNMNVIYYDKPIDESYFNYNIDKKYDVICYGLVYNIESVDKRWVNMDQYNVPLYLANIIYGLMRLNIGGNLIINFVQIRNKSLADLVLICKSVFDETHLYCPQVHNLIKSTGTVAIFKNYKGISDSELKKLLSVFEQYYNYDNELVDKYNIIDPKMREYLEVTKPVDKSYEVKYIDGFLTNTTDKDYEFIHEFNKRLYLRKIKFLNKIEKALNMDQEQQKKYFESQRKKQLMHAVLYATKYGLDYYNLNEKFIDEYMERNILQHMSSVDMPVIYTFKHTDNKNMMELSDYFVNLTNKMHMLNFLIDTRDLDEYMRVSKQIRYYSPVEKYNNLKEIVSHKFDIKTSQAWLKMYELIIDTHLIIQEVGTYKSFHICEAPGNFIAALNHYIKTETKMKFEWNAQSLNPKFSGEAFGDMYGYIGNYPEQWLWGADDTGDITKEVNIKYYKKYCTDVQLIAGDCGVGHDVKDVELLGVMKVHFAQLLLILHCLPEGGDFVAKLYMTQHKPIQISMLYLIYQLFDSMTFYKGVVNTFSLEFYLIGRGYKGIKPDVEKRLFEILNNFDPNIDLYDNKYPEYFIYQLEYILKKLFENYKLTFDRELFYVDNIKYITSNYMTKIKDGIKYKNNDWIKRMHIKQINRNDVL